MQQPTVYRARRDQGWALLACSVPFLVIGVGTVWASTLAGTILTGVSGVGGVFVAAVGLATFRTRVALGPDGISKTPFFPNGFTIAWDAVEAWSVVDLGEERDTFSHRVVRFTVGWRRMEVREADVFHPGFDRFLWDVRSWVGGREAVPRENDSSVA